MASRFRVPLPALLLALLALVILRRRRSRSRRTSKRGHGPGAGRPGTLRYTVPVGQDPAGVISALRMAGYEVERDHAPTHIQDILIHCPAGVDGERTRVRSVIAQAPIDLEGAPAPVHEVVFADEPGPVPPTI